MSGQVHKIYTDGGYCLLCLKSSTPTQMELEQECKASKVNSIHQIFKYLKLNFEQVFSEGVSTFEIHPLSESKGYWHWSGLNEISLCEECTKLSEHFSKLFVQLEVIEMKLQACLKSIHGRMESAKECEGALEEFKRGRTMNSENGSFQQDVVKRLRKKTLELCYRKLSSVTPQVKLQRLIPNQVDDKKWPSFKVTSQSQIDISQIGQDHEDLPVDNENMGNEPVESDVKKTEWNVAPSTLLSGVGADNDATPSSDNDLKMTSLDNDPSHHGNVSAASEMEMAAGARNWIGDIPPPIPSSTPKIPKAIPIPGRGRQKCLLCSKEFKERNAFKVHYRRVHLKVRYICPLCRKDFSIRAQYKRHFGAHHMGITFKCEKCNKCYSDKSILRQHQQQRFGNCRSDDSSIPPPAPNHECNVCGKKFHYLCKLKTHMYLAHSPARNHLCSECGLGFKELSYLRKHINTVHLQIREHLCDLCGMKFKTKRNLNRHRQNIHKAMRLT